MTGEKELIPVEQREIDFYGDEITAVLVNLDGVKQVFIPIRPICVFLGLNWAGQRQRIRRDEILAEVSSECVIHSQGQRRTMLCLPLDYLNGWMFGINARRVNPEIKENLLRYQRECYRVLAEAFLAPEMSIQPVDADSQALMQLHNMALVIAATTKEMMQVRELSLNNKARLDAAREYLQGINQRLKVVEHQAGTAERRTRAGSLTEEQAREIQHRVNLVARAMTKLKPGEKHHMGIYEALRQETGATSYKSIPMKGYESAVAFLDDMLKGIESAAEQE